MTDNEATVLWNGVPIGTLVNAARMETRSMPPKPVGIDLWVQLAEGAPEIADGEGVVTLQTAAVWGREGNVVMIGVPVAGNPFTKDAGGG